MKRYVKLSVISLISLALFSTFFAFVEKPSDNKTSKEIARRGRGRHGRHGRRHGGGGFRFRFYVGPPRREYYRRPYYEYVRVNCEVFDDGNTQVKEVQIGDRTIFLSGGGDGHIYYFSLRPGYYTIKWRVSNERFFGSKFRNYSRSFRVYRDRGEVFITIKGSNFSVR